MKKHTLLLLLALVLLLSLTLSVSAAEVVESGTCGAEGDNLTWTLTDDGTLTIDGEGDMEDYEIPPWSQPMDVEVKKVVIGDSVISIGEGVFSGCGNLTDFQVAANNPNFATDEHGVLYSKDYTVLCACPRGKTGSYVIPDSVTTIGANAFCGCNSLTSITIGKTVTTIGGTAFKACGSLSAFQVAADNPGFATDEHGVLYNKDYTVLRACPGGKTGSYVIPDSVTTIGDYAFYGCDNLTDVTFGKNVTHIGEHAFYFAHLDSIDLPKSVTYIGDYAFCMSSGFESVYIPDTVTYIGSHIFAHYYVYAGPTSLTIGSHNGNGSGMVIADGAFSGCANMTQITLGNSITSIGDYAFEACLSLRSITFPASVTTIGSGLFNRCYELTEVIFQGDATTGSELFPAVSWANIPMTIYYPADNPTWTTTAMQEYMFDAEDYGGEVADITWIPYTTFSDVSNGAYYEVPVIWAYGNNITTGKTETTFGPDDGCTRAQVVTFLWRAAGEPEPESTTCAFTDVNPEAFYYKAMLWAVENGITTGTKADKFAPDTTCTRGQIVTFLHRANCEPEPTAGTCDFSDVDAKTYYYDAMLWAVENGITTGKSATRFAPDDTCTRGQVVTFLYRAYN